MPESPGTPENGPWNGTFAGPKRWCGPTAAGSPTGPLAAEPPTASPGEPPAQPDVPASPANEADPAAPGGESLDTRVEALTRQIVQLRKQLDDYEQKTRWRDVLGGIGYILGLMGVAFYFLGVRRKEKRSGD